MLAIHIERLSTMAGELVVWPPAPGQVLEALANQVSPGDRRAQAALELLRAAEEPVVRVEGDRVILVWQQLGRRPDLRAALARVVQQPVRLGRHEVLVRVRVRRGWAPASTLPPQSPSAAPRPVPTLRARGPWLAYALAADELLPLALAVVLAEGVRHALVAALGTPHPVLTGLVGEQVLAAPHLAVVPLPRVGERGADGMIVGLSLSLPAAATAEEVQVLEEAAQAWDGRFHVGSLERTAVPVATPLPDWPGLARWRGPSRRWATVTPIALGGHCPRLDHPDARQRFAARRRAMALVRRTVIQQLPSAGQLSPEDIGVTLAPGIPLAGAVPLSLMPRFRRKGHDRAKRLVHAWLELPVAVEGPLLLGAGRHFGLGLCAPVGAP